MKNRGQIKAYLAWITICIVWGTTYLAIRIGVHDFLPFLFAGFRWIIAGSILFTIMKMQGHKIPSKKDFPHIAVVGIALLGVANLFVVIAEQWIPSGLTALFITTIPILVAGIEFISVKNKSWNLYLTSGLLLGFAGVILILNNNLTELFNSSYFLGIGFLFIAVLSWAAGSVYSKHKKLKTHPLMGASIPAIQSQIIQVPILNCCCRTNFPVCSWLNVEKTWKNVRKCSPAFDG